MKIKLNKIVKGGKAIYLAYDQGLEHGPSEDFNEDSVNPLYILDIAKKGNYQGIIFQKGIAEKYQNEIKKSKVPLIIKLNGKTKLYTGEPKSVVLGTVEEAVKLGASAVGFTIYVGSKYEGQMLEEFSKIEKDAHLRGIPVISWIYPRGKSIKNSKSGENLAYSARTGLEIGADVVKVHWDGKLNDLKWAVKSAGRTKLIVAGGSKMNEKELLKFVGNVRDSGAMGLAIGRNIWQSKGPLKLTEKIKKVFFK